MQNPFKSSDDGVRTDEADREHAGGRTDADGDEATEHETKAAGYRDDPSLLAASSDYAQRGTTNQYSGQSRGDESGNFAGGREARGMHSGSQEQWRGAPASASAAPSDSPAEAGEADASQGATHGEGRGEVPSRSANPGPSSHGGFESEGPSSHDAQEQKVSNESRHGDDDASQ